MRPVEDYDIQMARLDPRASRLTYRIERLMLTPLFRFTLRAVLPAALAFGAGTAWFSVEENRTAFNTMIADIRNEIESRPEFQVSLMAIDGTSAEIAEDIRAALNTDFPVSSFDLDLEEMHGKVVAIHGVKAATLRIRQGGVLQVDVTQRVPAVQWRTVTGLELLDDAGIYVGLARSRSEHTDLPVIAGDMMTPDEQAALLVLRQAESEGEETLAALRRDAPEILALALSARRAMGVAVAEALAIDAVSGPIRARVRGYERMGARRWDVVMDRGQRILLPETGAVQALERAIAMQQAVQMLDRDLLSVDLRLPHRPTVRMTEAATRALWEFREIEAGVRQQ